MLEMQECELMSQVVERMETVQEVPDFTLNSRARVGH